VTKNTPYVLSLVVLVKNWFRVVSVNNNGVRKVCREVLPGRVPGRSREEGRGTMRVHNVNTHTKIPIFIIIQC